MGGKKMYKYRYKFIFSVEKMYTRRISLDFERKNKKTKHMYVCNSYKYKYTINCKYKLLAYMINIRQTFKINRYNNR